MKLATLKKTIIIKKYHEDGTKTVETINKQLNLSPGDTPCLRSKQGCKELANDGEWFCPKCLEEFDKRNSDFCLPLKMEFEKWEN